MKLSAHILIVAAVLFTAAPVYAVLTYNLIDVPDEQDGWTLSGHISTDGTLGEISASNITGWQWQITKGDVSHSLSSSDPGTSAVITGVVIADPSFLTLSITPELYGHLRLVTSVAPYHDLYWSILPDVDPLLHIDSHGTFPVYVYDVANGWSAPGRVIAQVPEPGTFMLCCVGALGMGLYHRRRRRSA